MARPPILLLAWRNAIASEEGPADPFDRLVALTMSLYMSSSGERCWPNQETVAARAGLAKRTVWKALNRLVDAKWLEREPRKSPRGNRHKRYGYEFRARFPAALANAYANGARRALFSGRDPTKEGRKSNGARHDISMVHPVRTNSVEELVKGDAFNSSDPLTAEEIADIEHLRNG